MSKHQQTFVIVGASLAGARAAETLREEGFDGRLVLIGDEPERPYERPPLTKDYLRAASPREKAYVHPETFYGDHDIELMTATTATALDPGSSRITLDDERELGYDRLLLTTGAEPRRIPIPGADHGGIHYLRTLADCDALRERLDTGGSVVVIGAGWIGAEFTASARQQGADVTVVDPMSVPLERVLGPEAGAVYRDLHREHGVQLLLGTGVEGFEGERSVRAVKTGDGRTFECDSVVVGIGVVPRVELAEAAGLKTENGIVVDRALATSAPGVYAAGDVANAWHPFYERHVRVEHWANALNQGPTAARAMLGQAVCYDRIPYFFSDQCDAGMEYSGFATEWDEVVFRGDPAAREFVAFWLSDQRVVAGMNLNVWDVNEHVQALIRSRRTVDAAALTDPDIALDSLGRAVARRICIWREEVARRMDRPPSYVIPDHALMELARRTPKDRAALESIRGLPQQTLHRRGAELVEQIARGRSEEAPPPPPKAPKRDPSEAPLMSLAQAVVRHRSRESGIATELIATQSELA